MTQQAINEDGIRREQDSKLNDLRTRYELLSSRERKVLKLVSAGLLNKQMAGELRVSEITVQIHRRILMHTLGAKSLPDLVRIADVLGVAARGGAMS